MKKPIVLFYVIVLALISGSWAHAYDFPLANEYAATIIGTPQAFKAELPEKINYKRMKLKVFKDREVPEVLWHERQLRYSVVKHKEKAPLIFVIAGTGGGFNTGKVVMLQRAFYKAGFHSVGLTSPTHPNFVAAASETKIPGSLVDDAKDLYRVMELIWNKLKGKLNVSEFYITGYSLGAAQAAFVSKLDEEKGSFNFKKVYMINPPVSLYNSVNILDHMFVENIPGGLDNFNEFWIKMTGRFAEVYKESDAIEFNNEFLYDIYKRRHPPDENMQALIGLAFRASSMNMLFTVDVMTNVGYVKPKNLVLSYSDSMTDYFKVYARRSFTDYFNEIFYPYHQSKQPGLTRQEVIDAASLKSIEGYLQKSEKIRLVHNEDDLILAKGEIDYLRKVFGDRARIYPDGGHCGNMDHRDNVKHMIDFFELKEVPK